MFEIKDRFHAVVTAHTSPTRRWKELEDLSGIPAANWLAAIRNKQRPTAEMLEAAARAWPQYAFWLLTGITDCKHGHTTPIAKAYPEHWNGPLANSNEYFAHAVHMYKTVYGSGPGYSSEEEQNEAIKRYRVLVELRQAEIDTLKRLNASSGERAQGHDGEKDK